MRKEGKLNVTYRKKLGKQRKKGKTRQIEKNPRGGKKHRKIHLPGGKISNRDHAINRKKRGGQNALGRTGGVGPRKPTA